MIDEDEDQMKRSSKFFAQTFLFLGFAFAALAAIPALRKLLKAATSDVFAKLDKVANENPRLIKTNESETPSQEKTIEGLE